MWPRARGGEARQLVSEVRHPRDLVWPPDGDLLAFSGELRGEMGTWAANLEGDVEKVSDAETHWLDWSPDGSKLIGLRPDGDSDYEIVAFDRPSI